MATTFEGLGDVNSVQLLPRSSPTFSSICYSQSVLLTELASGILSSPNSMEFSLDGEAISYKPPVIASK